MKNIKTYATAVWAIAEKPLLTLMGLGLIAAGVLKFDERELRMIAAAIGAVSFVAGIMPMFWAFAKANWPKKVGK
jgi:hypothetical protein